MCLKQPFKRSKRTATVNFNGNAITTTLSCVSLKSRLVNYLVMLQNSHINYFTD